MDYMDWASSLHDPASAMFVSSYGMGYTQSYPEVGSGLPAAIQNFGGTGTHTLVLLGAVVLGLAGLAWWTRSISK